MDDIRAMDVGAGASGFHKLVHRCPYCTNPINARHRCSRGRATSVGFRPRLGRVSGLPGRSASQNSARWRPHEPRAPSPRVSSAHGEKRRMCGLIETVIDHHKPFK